MSENSYVKMDILSPIPKSAFQYGKPKKRGENEVITLPKYWTLSKKLIPIGKREYFFSMFCSLQNAVTRKATESKVEVCQFCGFSFE